MTPARDDFRAAVDVVDCHCHAGDGDGFTGPWDTSAPLEPHLTRAAEAGITHTIVFAAFHTDYARANEAVAALVRANAGRLSGLAFVHSARDRGRIHAMVERAVGVHGFRGIKCHRYDSALTREVCDAARNLRVPILYDVMGEVETIDCFAPEFPDVAFVIPHLGSFADDWRKQRSFIDRLVRHPNVHTDTSGVRRFDLLVEAIERAGAGKVLFGSDGPWLHPGVELAKVRALRLSASDRALVEGANARRIFGIRANHGQAASVGSFSRHAARRI